VLSGLPSQAGQTVQWIYAGGPFPYRQDGVIFDNRERRLPGEPHGYYHEYTVRTPGSADRGARRIIAGGTNETAPQVLYYTANHYASFCLVSGLD
jgi:ribonuclease T1